MAEPCRVPGDSVLQTDEFSVCFSSKLGRGRENDIPGGSGGAATEGGFILSPSNEGWVSAGACFGLLANILIGTVWHVGPFLFALGCERGNPQLSVPGMKSRKKAVNGCFVKAEGLLEHRRCFPVGKWRCVVEVQLRQFQSAAVGFSAAPPGSVSGISSKLQCVFIQSTCRSCDHDWIIGVMCNLIIVECFS